MASVSPVQEIQEEAKCSICWRCLTDPVTMCCGHNFCQVCITQHCDIWTQGEYGTLRCPNCREQIQKGAFRNNCQLGNIVEKIKQLDIEQGIGSLCGRHNRPLELFCEKDWEAMCVVCWRNSEHRSHTMLLIEEAAQKYEEKIQFHLKNLSEEREKILGFKSVAEEKCQEYLKQMETKRQKIVSEFQQRPKFLEGQEGVLLVQLEKLEKEIVKIQTENITKLSAEISRLSDMISEMEENCQRPASEFLQNVRSILSRYEKGKFQQPVQIFSLELENRLRNFFQKTVALMDNLWKFKANVILDPDTANPQLILSEDGESVRWADTPQDLPDNPERFDTAPCVLGCEGFTSGRHCWEVEVGSGLYWAVGVARKSVRRKGRIPLNSKLGIWAVGWLGDQFWALTTPRTPLPQTQLPSSIWVSVDCDQEQVTFLDAGDGAPIFTFPPGSVPRVRLHPWLWVGPGSLLRLCP